MSEGMFSHDVAAYYCLWSSRRQLYDSKWFIDHDDNLAFDILSTTFKSY